MNSPTDQLRAGVVVLSPLLQANGFTYVEGSAGNGSGGLFASGEFQRGNHWLELHFRYSLGLVAYHLGANSLTHEEYMWSVLGKRHASRYPGFSDDPLNGFRNLTLDLEERGSDFLVGSDADFVRHFQRIRSLQASAPRIP